MTQPRYVPIEIGDEVRPSRHLDVPRPWAPHRPGEHRTGGAAPRGGTGTAGPDQGYALLLATRLAPRVVLGRGERIEDGLAVAVAVALRRAARFGRAPVQSDIAVALDLLGYLEPVPDAVAEARRSITLGGSHDAWRKLLASAVVPDDVLGTAPAEAHVSRVNWESVVVR